MFLQRSQPCAIEGHSHVLTKVKAVCFRRSQPYASEDHSHALSKVTAMCLRMPQTSAFKHFSINKYLLSAPSRSLLRHSVREYPHDAKLYPIQISQCLTDP